MKQAIANSSLELDPSFHESEVSGEAPLDLSLDSVVDWKEVNAVSPPPAIVTEIPALEPRLVSPGRQRKLNPIAMEAAPLSPEKSVLESPKSPAKRSSSGMFMVKKQPPLSPTDKLLYVSPTPPASPPPVEALESPSRKKVSTKLSTALADKIAAVAPAVKSSEAITTGPKENKTKKKEKSEPIKMDPPPTTPRVIEAEPAPVITPTAQPVQKQQVIFMSPLLKSNERKRLQTDPKRYWSKVREQRLAIDSVLDMLKQVEDLNTAVAADFDTVRVRQYGVTGEYLFKQSSEVQVKIEQELDNFRTEQMIQKIETTRKKPPKRTPSNLSNYTVMSGTSYKDQKETASVQISRTPSHDEQVSEPARKRASSALPPQPQPLPSIRMSELLHATFVIQHWFREWRKRRSLRFSNMASMAESEAVDARAALRKRRQERRGRDASPVIISSLIETAGPSTADWIRSLITPVAQQVNTMPPAN